MGAFKFRGAYNAISQFTPDQMQAGVIAFSSGNHAQAIALAAKLLGTSATIVMPEDAPEIKLRATREYGARVILYDRYSENRETIGQLLADEEGGTMIPPFDHPHIIAGQGTAVKELIEDAGELDVVITSLGGGGLLAGSALATHALCPNAAIYGVEPEAGNDGQQSFHSGEIVTIETPRTIADGAQTLHLGDLTFPIIREHVTDIVTATDEQLLDAMRFMAFRMKQVVEPTGCLPLAAVLNGAIDVRGKRVGMVLSGGNVSENILRIGS
jgi:threonine dehydratase